MKSKYEVLNVDLAQEYTKVRKLEALKQLGLDEALYDLVIGDINALDIPEDDDRLHWINVIAAKAAADLLTIGKVQPEHMMAMAALPAIDFKECVKIATTNARKLNTDTIDAEKSLNIDTLSNAVV
jgi:chemotaxis regulatin CheY-phosphate phosphatase CheZ